MKRIWIAVGLMLAAIGLCLCTRLYQKKQTTVLLGQLDRAIAAFEQGDMKQTDTLAREFSDQFPKRTALFPCFLIHRDVTECEVSAKILPLMLGKDNEDFIVEATKCRVLLEHLRESEALLITNIL